MHRFGRHANLCVRAALVGLVLGVLCAATLAASAGSARSIERPRTLFAGSRRIYAFALGAHRITWSSRAQNHNRASSCQMYVRLRPGLTSRAPLPSAGCGAAAPDGFAAQAPVLASGQAAWVKGYSCGKSECSWAIATITGGEDRPRRVERAAASCDFVCGRFGPTPRPVLAGAGDLLVYSTPGPGADPAPRDIGMVRRIVGRQTVFFAGSPGQGSIESLTAEGSALEVGSRALVGDGCGCADSPAWSPDGSKIAYLDGRFYNQQSDQGPPIAALAVMNADGSGRHDLTAPFAAWGVPEFSWSPDGKQIAYDDPNGGVAVIKVDGLGSLNLGDCGQPAHPCEDHDPAWSPDGSKIAFERACGPMGPSPCGIFVMNADGTNAHLLASGCRCGGIAWSPDGTRIAFSDGTLEVMDANGTNGHRLSADVAREPAWSPDSTQIAFRGAKGLWKIGADGSGPLQLTSNTTDEHPSWSPDGKAIVFGSDRNDPYANAHDPYPQVFPELYLIALDGSGLRPLSFSKPAAIERQKTFYSVRGTPLPSLPGVPALAGDIAAVGHTSSNGAHKIMLFNATTGTQLAEVDVGARKGRFAVAGADASWVVFHIGTTISALNAGSHQVVRLTTAAANPLGLSVSGQRVAWAENIQGHGRIRALDLPN